MLTKNENVDWVFTDRVEIFRNKKISPYSTEDIDPIKVATAYQHDSNRNLECFRNTILDTHKMRNKNLEKSHQYIGIKPNDFQKSNH